MGIDAPPKLRESGRCVAPPHTLTARSAWHLLCALLQLGGGPCHLACPDRTGTLRRDPGANLSILKSKSLVPLWEEPQCGRHQLLRNLLLTMECAKEIYYSGILYLMVFSMNTHCKMTVQATKLLAALTGPCFPAGGTLHLELCNKPPIFPSPFRFSCFK